MEASRLQVMIKKKKVDFLDLYHDDLLLEIFKKLSPNLLRYNVRFVCRRWFNLITNIILLDHASLILQKPATSHRLRLMDIRETEQGLKMKRQYVFVPYSGCIKSWCNEYLLITDQKKSGSLYMFNLITQRGSLLPPCSKSCEGHYCNDCGVGLSYDESQGVYKVVHVFNGPPVQCEILVLKSNNIHYDWSEWKKVNGPDCTGQRHNWDDPVSVQGRYLHWDVGFPEYLVSMDTVKERFSQTCLPGSKIDIDKRYSMVEMGGFLALLHKISSDQINIWMLKDSQRTKWEKYLTISSDVGLRIYSGSVVTCVRSKRYIIFRKRGFGSEMGLYSFDLKNKIMKRLEIDIVRDERCVVPSTSGSFW